MIWEAYYYINQLPLIKYSSIDYSYDDLPEDGLVMINIIKGDYNHLIYGMDNYWIDNNKYGMFNNTGELAELEEEQRRLNGNQEVEYIGYSNVAWSWDEQHIFLNDYQFDENIKVIKGIMLPDNIAKEIGLI